MKIKDFLEKLDGMEDKEREEGLLKLAQRFAPESLGSTMQFQQEWIESNKSKGIKRSFEEFKKEQNKLIRSCVKMEDSKMGAHVRANRGLPRWDSEIDLDESPFN